MASISPPGLFGLLARYKGLIGLLVALTIVANGLSVAVPKIIAGAIDTYASGNFVLARFVIEFSVVAVLIFVFTYLQNIVQVFASERVARDMLTLLPTDVAFLTELATLRSEQGDAAAAASLFRDALILDPENVVARRFLKPDAK